MAQSNEPEKLMDADDILTADEQAMVRRGEEQIQRGESLTLDQLEHLDRHCETRTSGRTRK